MLVSKYVLGLALALLAGQMAVAQAQMSYNDTKRTIKRIKEWSDTFDHNFDRDVRKSGVDSDVRHEMKKSVERFEEATKYLEDSYDQDNAAVPAVRAVLREGAVIDAFMARNIMSPRVQSEWLLLRQDLDLLAGSYGLTAEWPSALARAETSPPPAVVVLPVPSGSEQLRDLVQDIHTHGALFQSNVRSALASSTEPESAIHQYIGDFMVSAERLRASYTGGTYSAGAANEVLSNAEPIDLYMRNYPLSIAAQESWLKLRNDLIRLAAAFSLSPVWLSR